MNISSIAGNKTLCCGCNACASICPRNAITMVEDEVGQLYPSVDINRCVDCSLCNDVCCEKNPVARNTPLKSFAATYRNQDVSSRSSSGGIFAALAETVLAEGGIVYGTSYTNGFIAQVIGIETLEDLYLLQGSKYVKSSMGDIYQAIHKQLETGRKVLFSGVPCQTAAVKQYLHKNDTNLVTVDLVCHGTPSNRMFLDYLNYLQQKKKKRIAAFNFRDKNSGQDVAGNIVYQESRMGRTIYKRCRLKSYQSSYYKLFLNGVTFRESCYHCQFASPKRVGDITLCDYWGIDEVNPVFMRQVHDEGLCGVSAVMINSAVGEKTFGSIQHRIMFVSTDYADVRKFNPQLNQSSAVTEEHQEVMKLYAASGYEAVDQYYFRKYRTKIIASSFGQVLSSKTKKQLLALKRKIVK